MNGDTGRNPTSGDAFPQTNQREIKHKGVKSEKPRCLDLTKMLSCSINPREHRLNKVEEVKNHFNDEKKKIEEMFSTIPQALATSFKTKIDFLTTEFQESSKHYESQSRAGSKIIRDLNERNMQLTHESLQKMRKELEKDWGLLNSFQEAITEHKQALDSVRQDDQPLARERAETQVESAMKKYSLALQSRGLQGYERLDAKKQIEETSRWLQESSKALNLRKLGEMQRQFEETRVDETQAWIKNAPASNSNDTLPHIERSIADTFVNDFKQAHRQVLDSYQQPSDIKSLQDARKRFEKAYDRVRTLFEYLNQWNKTHEFKAQLEAAHSEDPPYDKSIKDLFDKAIDTVRNAYQDVLACLQDGWPHREENIGNTVRKGADQRFQKACDQLKTLSETSSPWKQIHELQVKYIEALSVSDKEDLKRVVEIADKAFKKILDPYAQRKDWQDSKQSIEGSHERLKDIVRKDLYEKWIKVQKYEEQLHKLEKLENVQKFKRLAQESIAIVEKSGLSSFSSFREVETQALAQLKEICALDKLLESNHSYNYFENVDKVRQIGKLLINCKQLNYLDQLDNVREFKNVTQKHDQLLKQLENLKNKEDLDLLHLFQEARKEHKEALNYVRQDYQFLVRKLAETPVVSPMADYGLVVLQGDQRRHERLPAKKQIEETSRWLKERSRALKKLGEMQINYQIEQIERKLQQGNAHSHHQNVLDFIELIRIQELDKYKSFYDSQLEQFNNKSNGEVKPPTLMPDQWRQKFEEISADITLTIMHKSPELPITDKWEKCCASHDALVICMGDELKNIDTEIHENMETYKKNMENHKKRREELDKHLDKYKSLFAETRELESQLDEARELESQLASKEDESKSALAKAKQLIDDMEAEHEKFKEYLRDRGWLEKDTSTRVPVSHSIRPHTDIASTSG